VIPKKKLENTKIFSISLMQRTPKSLAEVYCPAWVRLRSEGDVSQEDNNTILGDGVGFLSCVSLTTPASAALYTFFVRLDFAGKMQNKLALTFNAVFSIICAL
jgi:hypothetical protein